MERKGKMLKRILTALIGLVVFAAVIFSHHYVLYCAVTLIIMALLYEVYSAMDFDKNVKLTGYGAALVLCIGFVINARMLAVFGAIVLFMATLIRRHGTVKAVEVLASCAVTLFVSMFINRNNPKREILICAFNELVRTDLYELGI